MDRFNSSSRLLPVFEDENCNEAFLNGNYLYLLILYSFYILNFGSEIWGMHDATDVERIHTKFLRYVLGVKKSTNLAALYGELGRVPLSVFRKVIMLKYWIKILKQPDSSLVKLTYFMLKEDADANISYNGKNLSFQIKQILQTHGFEYIWDNQSEVEIPFCAIRQRIFDIFKQNWYSNINN